MNWWLTEAWQYSPVFAVSWIVWIIVAIVLHELGHGIAAIRCGDDTPRYLGHMTINPFVHIPGTAWILFVLLGFTYGLMPVNPHNFNGRYDDAKVAFAGPLVNVILAIVCIILAGVWLVHGGFAGEPLYTNLTVFLSIGASLNVVLVFFNLIPVPPLDGSTILGNFVPAYKRVFLAQYGGVAAMIMFALLFVFASRPIQKFGTQVSSAGIQKVVDVLGGFKTPKSTP